MIYGKIQNVACNLIHTNPHHCNGYMQNKWQCWCSKKMLCRKRSEILKLVCAAYFPWCSAYKSRGIEPACCPFVNKSMDSASENTVITLKWRLFY